MLLAVASEYKTSAWVSKEKILALSDSVEEENSEQRLQMVPADKFITPFVISEMHCFVLAIETL